MVCICDYFININELAEILHNMKLNFSRIELDKSKKNFEAMKSSKTLDEYEENWRNFVTNLEKIWIKSERECLEFKNKFQPWQGKFKNERRIDPLLKYVKNARDVETHSIQEIVEKKDGYTTVNPLDRNKPLEIKNLLIADGKISFSESSQPLIVKHHSAKIIAIPFRNQGVVYLPPEFHRGRRLLDKSNPIEIAQLAINYYENYLSEIESKF